MQHHLFQTAFLVCQIILSVSCAHHPTEEHPMETDIAELVARPPSGRVVIAERILAYAEYGDVNGTPVLYFTGGDSSRLEGLWLDDAARDLGVRVIVPDRPGFGDSDPLPGRTLTDWPDDAAALADALGVDRYAVLGLSGGGPHALATAWAQPDRVTRVVVVGSAPPPQYESLARDVAFPFRLLALLTRRAPWALKKVLRQQQELAENRPDKLLRQTIRGVSDADADFLKDGGGALYVATKRLGYQNGVDGSVQEHLLYRTDWGFDLAEIRVPTVVLIGEDDVMASCAVNAAIAETIPDAEFDILPGEGHLSLIPSQAKAVLSRLLEQ